MSCRYTKQVSTSWISRSYRSFFRKCNSVLQGKTWLVSWNKALFDLLWTTGGI